MTFDHEIFIKTSPEVERRWKTQTFNNFVQGSIRSDFNESCLGHLGPSLVHPRSWFWLTIFFDLRSLQENREGRIIRKSFRKSGKASENSKKLQKIQKKLQKIQKKLQKIKKSFRKSEKASKNQKKLQKIRKSFKKSEKASEN